MEDKKSAVNMERYNHSDIVSICLESGTTTEIAEKIANEIDYLLSEEEKLTIAMFEVRKIIFTLLHKYDLASSRRFKTDEIYIRTGSDKFEIFDRVKISRSLIEETGIEEEQADIIAREADKFIANLNLFLLQDLLYSLNKYSKNLIFL